MRRTVPLIIGIFLLSGAAAYAHHSYAATYETTDARGGRRHQRTALLTFPTDNGVISQNVALAIR